MLRNWGSSASPPPAGEMGVLALRAAERTQLLPREFCSAEPTREIGEILRWGVCHLGLTSPRPRRGERAGLGFLKAAGNEGGSGATGKVLLPARVKTSRLVLFCWGQLGHGDFHRRCQISIKSSWLRHGPPGCVCAAGTSVPGFAGKLRGEVSSLRGLCSDADQNHTQRHRAQGRASGRKRPLPGERRWRHAEVTDAACRG